MSAENASEGRRLDRRGFLGAAAGVAVVGAAASPIAWAKKLEGPDCAEVAARIPKARRGAIHYTLPAQAWNNTAVFQDTIGFFKSLNINAWEFAGQYPLVNSGVTPTSTISLNDGINRFPAGHAMAGLSGWEAFGSYANTYGFRLVGTHDGPSPTSAAALGSAITKMNAWSCNQLGAGGGYPSGAINLPGAGTAITNPSAISAWQASAATMNSWGQAYQTGHGPVLGSTAYGAGVFQGTALTAGRPCARYYRHFHSEQGKWIQNTGTKYDGHYISELIYTETDPTVAYAQSDQCWLLDGLWMAGGAAPSVGLQGPGDPHPGQGKNRLVQPDLMERWQDSVFSFHIKDLGSGTAQNDQGTSVCNVGDNAGPGAATYPYGAVPWATDGSQDTVPFQEIYERFRHPELHEYLFERDGMSNTVTSNAYWRKLYVQVGDMYDKLVLNRDPDTIREPFAVPHTDAEWAATAGNVIGNRPPKGDGAPGPECPPTTNGKSEVGQDINVSFRGTWSRFNETDQDKYSYLWLRDGTPIQALYNGAPIQGGACGIVGERSYTIRKEDGGHLLSCQVTAFNDGAATSVVTDAVLVEGGWNKAMDNDLVALRATIVGMGLLPAPTDRLTTKVDSIRHWLSLGESVCVDLDEFKVIVADLKSHNKVTADQATTLNSAADSIKAKSVPAC
jgi:hypothetical protein